MKAVIVVDIEEHGDYYADVYRKDADDRFEGRYYLKPLPSKSRKPFTKTFGTPYNIGKAEGWNRCLDEILGETNG